jgi:universal stress protein F
MRLARHKVVPGGAWAPAAPRGPAVWITTTDHIGGVPHSRSARKRGNMCENQLRERGGAMYKKILVPIDLADPDLAKPAVATALMMAGASEGTIRFVNVLPLTPVMLAEYVPPDFEVQQRKAAEDALAIVVQETGLPSGRVSSTVRQGGIYQEILDEANSMQPDLIVMSSHRPQRHAVRTYFLGSNAGHVVRYAKCSVLVVRN